MSISSGPDYERNLKEIGIEKYILTPAFMVEFCKALGIKRRCYHRWINNEAIRFINELYRDVEQATDEQEKRDMVREALKAVTMGIRFQVDEAYLRGYKPEHYEPNGVYNNTSITYGNDAYIVLYAIHRQLCMYLEVQERHLQYVPADEVMTIEEAYQYFCNHLCSKHVVRVVPEGAPQAEKPVLIPCKGDLRRPPKGVLPYDEMIRNPEKFAWFEQELFASHYIDAHYRFQNKKGHQTELAMMVVHLAARKYFYPKTIPAMKSITLVDIRRFFEFRFDFRMDRALPLVRKNRQAIDAFVAQLHWLDKLPGC